MSLLVDQLAEPCGNDPPDRHQPAGAVLMPSGVGVLMRVEGCDGRGVVLSGLLGDYHVERDHQAYVLAGMETVDV